METSNAAKKLLLLYFILYARCLIYFLLLCTLSWWYYDSRRACTKSGTFDEFYKFIIEKSISGSISFCQECTTRIESQIWRFTKMQAKLLLCQRVSTAFFLSLNKIDTKEKKWQQLHSHQENREWCLMNSARNHTNFRYQKYVSHVWNIYFCGYKSTKLFLVSNNFY